MPGVAHLSIFAAKCCTLMMTNATYNFGCTHRLVLSQLTEEAGMVVVCGFKSIHHPEILYAILNNDNFPPKRHVEKWFMLLIHTFQASVLLSYDAVNG
jgi:hypothetical protein